MSNNALIALAVAGSLLFITGCVMEPYGYEAPHDYGHENQGRHDMDHEDQGRRDYGYDGQGRHDYGHRVWRE